MPSGPETAILPSAGLASEAPAATARSQVTAGSSHPKANVGDPIPVRLKELLCLPARRHDKLHSPLPQQQRAATVLLALRHRGEPKDEAK